MTEDSTYTLIEEMENLAERASIEIIQLENKRDDIDSQIKRLRALQRAVAPEPIKRRVTRVTNGNGKRAKVSPVAKAKVLADFILSNYTTAIGDTFTALDVREAMGDPWSEPMTYSAFNYLREIEFLAKVGKDPETKRELWKILDADAIERIG